MGKLSKTNDEKISKIHPLIAKLVALATSSLRMFIISNISKDLSFQCSPAVSFDNDMTEMREGGTTKGIRKVKRFVV